MDEKDYRLVFVGNTQVGLIGLKDIFEDGGKIRDGDPSQSSLTISF
jgi:hypothetical protein